MQQPHLATSCCSLKPATSLWSAQVSVGKLYAIDCTAWVLEPAASLSLDVSSRRRPFFFVAHSAAGWGVHEAVGCSGGEDGEGDSRELG